MNQNNIQFQYKPRRQERPSRYIMERALGLSPNSYKNHLSSQFITQKQQQQLSQTNFVKHRNVPYYIKKQEPQLLYKNQNSSFLSGNKDYVRNLISQKREINDQRKQQMMRKVKELQEKVLPMIENDRNEGAMNEFGWQNRMQQKIIKLQTSVDQMKNQLEILMEKKILQVEQKWQHKFQEIEAIVHGSLYSSRENASVQYSQAI